MKTFRIAAGILAVIALALTGYINFLSPMTFATNTVGELIFLVFGVPILTVNLWACVEPEVIEVYFFGKDLPKQESNLMGNTIADKELATEPLEN